MKKILTVMVLTTLTGCATGTQQKVEVSDSPAIQPITIYKNNKKGMESIITRKALDSYNSEYLDATENKAFAQSLTGAWDWKSNRTSVEHAKTSALVGCQRHNRKSEDVYPCEIININGVWVE
ncbi:MAG: hypothetical protein P1U57_12530 [Oleibacter sp.]|nr:hypothetical protein [Thalassolituus sp.]